MNITITADLHLSNNLPFSRPKKGPITDRLLDGLSVLADLGVVAAEGECEQLWVLGDLFDSNRLDGITLKLALPILTSIAELMEIHIIPGNHERYNAACEAYVVDWLSGIDNIFVHDKPEKM